MGVSGITSSSDLQQVQLSMLAAAMDGQQAMLTSMAAANQSIDLSFLGKGLNIDVQA